MTGSTIDGGPVDVVPEVGDALIDTSQPATFLRAGALQSAIFNSANFSSIATDAKGVIQIFNVGAERMLGYSAAEVMNKVTPAEISDPQEVIARAEALSIELATPIAPGFEALVFKASRGIEDIYELTYIRKDGSRFPAVVSVTALRDERDAIIGYLLIGTDNTARKQIEEERKKLDQRLRDQQFYTRSLIESNIDALMTTDPQGIITDVNKQMEALTGCTRDELIGAPFKSYFTDPESAEAAIKQVLAEGKITNYELTARSRDGRETVVSYNAATFHDRERTLQGVFAAARDITDRKQAESRLQQTVGELEAFSYSVSHDLRGPLRSIDGFTQALVEDYGPTLSGDAKRYLDLVRASAQEMGRLIDDLLRLSLISRSEMRREPVDLSATAEAVIATLQGREPDRHVAWQVQPGLHAVGDPPLLRAALENLLANAWKFSGKKADACIEVGRTNGPVPEFYVRDNGVGFDPAYADKLFGAFQRLHAKTEFEGTGIGLATVRRVVRRHGGEIRAEAALGAGATFFFTLADGKERPS